MGHHHVDAANLHTCTVDADLIVNTHSLRRLTHSLCRSMLLTWWAGWYPGTTCRDNKAALGWEHSRQCPSQVSCDRVMCLSGWFEYSCIDASGFACWRERCAILLVEEVCMGKENPADDQIAHVCGGIAASEIKKI